MKGMILLLISVCCIGNVFGQVSSATLGMFAKQPLPYSAPDDTFSDQYLEEGEESTVPYKMLTAEQLKSISGEDECQCIAYAVHQIPLKGGNVGLIVYQINEVQVMPYEELSYHLYVVDAKGNAVDNITLNSEFYTSSYSDAEEIFISESRTATIAYGEFEDTEERIFIEITYETSESLMADFGQTKTTISNEISEIVSTGKIVNVTVFIED